MEKTSRLTVEIIEAAIGSYHSQIRADMSRSEIIQTDNYAERYVFEYLAERSESLRIMLSAQEALLADPPLHNSERRTDFASVAATMFFLGWHARGAVEDADRLRGMVE